MAPLGIAFLILMVAAPAAVYGVDHTVGDTAGWNSGVDYVAWASGKTFTVGDTLVFNFLGNHAVDEVNQADYNGCSSGNAIENHDSSPAKITLSKAGPRYFICPTPGHCANGMKVLITVVAASTPTPTTPTTPSPPTTTPSPPATTPAPPTSTPAPPTSTTPAGNDSPPPPPPPPKIPSPASSLHMNLVGVPLVLATLIALMG